jgi:hypothetical protein
LPLPLHKAVLVGYAKPTKKLKKEENVIELEPSKDMINGEINSY